MSHGSPAFFVQQRCFVTFHDDHHGDGRLALWCAAPDGAQAELLALEPDRYFRPPYVGGRGWVGADLRLLEPAELTGLCRDAWLCSASVTARRDLERATPEGEQRAAGWGQTPMRG
jgi:hypothetical protein